MRKSAPRQWVLRVLVYAFGLLLMAFAVGFAVNSDLGVSPVSSLPYVISLAAGVPLSRCVVAVFCFYILLQVLMLRQEFRPVQLFQIAFSTLFGYFVSFAGGVMGDFCFPGYLGRLGMLAVSIVLTAVGVLLYIGADLVPMPMEGLSLTLSRRRNVPFPRMKLILDCVSVAAAVLISLLVLHRLDGIREGTILTAVLVGPLMSLLRPVLNPLTERICFGGSEK